MFHHCGLGSGWERMELCGVGSRIMDCKDRIGSDRSRTRALLTGYSDFGYLDRTEGFLDGYGFKHGFFWIHGSLGMTYKFLQNNLSARSVVL